MKLKVDLKEYKKEEAKNGVRLNKYLSEVGIFSRREADKLIEGKKIHINDRVALLGEKVKNGDSVFINQKLAELKYFIYNKKKGEETAHKIIDKVRYDPVGRLDKESEGLLIYSNDFRIVEKLLNPSNEFEREYVVMVRETTTPRVKNILEKGISTREATYSPAKKVTLDDENRNRITIVLTEGKKHEIRRMLNALNLTILSLRRTRFLFLKLKGIKIGEIKQLTRGEVQELLTTLAIEKK